MSEAQLLEAIRQAASLYGWLCYHTHDSRRSAPGFPDLVLCHPTTGRLLCWELKSATGTLTADQWHWFDALSHSPATDVRIVRPADLDIVLDLLQRHAHTERQV
jgi:hypothetical protein